MDEEFQKFKYCEKYTYIQYMRLNRVQRALVRECHRCLDDIRYIENIQHNSIPNAFDSTEETISFKESIFNYKYLKFALERKERFCKNLNFDKL